MKNLFVFALALFLFTSCGKSDSDDIEICSEELSCIDENCLFTIDNEQGTVSFLTCFGSWAITVPSTDQSKVWYIVDDWDESYQEEGLTVTFCGYVRENTKPLLLPDPMPGTFYQIALENIEVSVQ